MLGKETKEYPKISTLPKNPKLETGLPGKVVVVAGGRELGTNYR